MSSTDSIFVGYPAKPAQVGQAIEQVATDAAPLRTWRHLDIPGHFIVDEVLDAINVAAFVAMDITKLNFNVTFEIGYAIAKGKRVVLTLNKSLQNDRRLIESLGIFDTIGYQEYENSQEFLARVLKKDATPLRLPAKVPDRASPMFILDTLHKTDASTRIKSIVKKARIRFRSFDPAEQPRLSAGEAFREISTAFGVVIPLLGTHSIDHELNNLRAAFLAGIAWGLEKPLLLLQEGDSPVPLDYRDIVKVYNRPNEIEPFIADLALEVTAALQSDYDPQFRPSVGLLASLSLGAVAAENEITTLGHYYIHTDQHRRALAGTARLAVGRKGSGKSALFFQVRDKLRRGRSVVLDLKPDGYQLTRFRELLETMFSESNREHAATAFWEYLLLVEVTHKILDKDKVRHTRDHEVYEIYRNLVDVSELNPYVKEGDFSLRMLSMTERIADDYRDKTANENGFGRLDSGRATESIYREDINAIVGAIRPYLEHLDAIWILVDNLDKGWPTHGVDQLGIVILKSLISAVRKIERTFRTKDEFETHSLVFLRNDVYELLIDETSDRGKEARISLDWTDRDLLLELLRRRLTTNKRLDDKESFENTWRRVCVSHIGAEDSSNWLLDRSLMRPRYLLTLVEHCIASAVNLSHERVEVDDFEKAARSYSADVASEIGFEMRDVMPESADIIYAFIGAPARISEAQIFDCLSAAEIPDQLHSRALELLLWFGFLGIAQGSGDQMTFIYDVLYDMKKLKALQRRSD